MASPSRKGYTDVPTTDVLVDVGSDNDTVRPTTNQSPTEPASMESSFESALESPNQDHLQHDDDELYTSNDPLLSRSAPEPIAFESSGQRGLFGSVRSTFRPIKLALLRFNFKRRFTAVRVPSRGVTTDSRWSPPNKCARKQRTLKWTIAILFLLVVSLTSTVIGLGVTLSKKPWIEYNCSPMFTRHLSHLPRFRKSYQSSTNFNLNFPETYPPLAPDADEDCKRAWSRLKYIPCHEKIWNRSWDNGKPNMFDPEIKYYASPMCENRCVQRLQDDYWMVSTSCSPTDKFDTRVYNTSFTADTELEDGPLAALSTIIRRLKHTCRKAPQWDIEGYRPYYPNRHSSSYFCTAQIYQDWFIVDGMNAGNLEGLDMFAKWTNEKKTIERNDMGYNYDYVEWLQWDNAREDQSSMFRWRDRRLGPGANETECGWCLLNWFERKIMSWNEGVLDPKTGKPVDLPDYVRRINALGSRCESGGWNRIYKKALAHYRDAGLLPRDS